jgi:outer membrane protein OmpA-like peptidoglycan-associated protein
MPTDEYFQTDKWVINAEGQQRLLQFFQKASAPNGFMIGGHTDSRASDAYNMALSQKRANAVALVAQQAGVKLFDVRGYGERYPRASNDTSRGRAENRRVEIICLQ